MCQLLVSNHAATRYAERIADKETKNDINGYVAKHMDKITKDINTMLDHAEFLYCGKLGNKNQTNVNAYIQGTWVILTDVNKKNVITIYKVEFNIGEDFNKTFVSKMMDKIHEDQSVYAETKKQLDSRKKSLEDQKNDNTKCINEYKALIKKLEQQNISLTDLIKDITIENTTAEMTLKEDIEKLVLKVEF